LRPCEPIHDGAIAWSGASTFSIGSSTSLRTSPACATTRIAGLAASPQYEHQRTCPSMIARYSIVLLGLLIARLPARSRCIRR
jgi:hypothetical protein